MHALFTIFNIITVILKALNGCTLNGCTHNITEFHSTAKVIYLPFQEQFPQIPTCQHYLPVKHIITELTQV